MALSQKFKLYLMAFNLYLNFEQKMSLVLV